TAPRGRSSPANRQTWSSGRAILSRSTARPSGCTTRAGWCSTEAIRSGGWIPTSILVRRLPEWDSEWQTAVLAVGPSGAHETDDWWLAAGDGGSGDCRL